VTVPRHGTLADKKAKKKSKIVLVSGFVPPPGRPRFGSPRQRVLGICAKRRFSKKNKKTYFQDTNRTKTTFLSSGTSFFGQNYGDLLVFFEICIFFENNNISVINM
jgi:hypothetical protein